MTKGVFVVTGSVLRGRRAGVISNIPMNIAESVIEGGQDALFLSEEAARSSRVSNSKLEGGRFAINVGHRERLLKDFRMDWPALSKVADPEIIAAVQVIEQAASESAYEDFLNTAIASMANELGEQTVQELFRWFVSALGG